MEKKKAIASLVLGILSLICWFIPIIGLPISVIGLILGISGMKEKREYALTGVICSSIGLGLSIINAVLGAYLGYIGAL